MPQQPERAGKVKKHKVETPSEEALKYWTDERKSKARATNMPHIGKPDQEKEPPRSPRRKD